MSLNMMMQFWCHALTNNVVLLKAIYFFFFFAFSISFLSFLFSFLSFLFLFPLFLSSLVASSPTWSAVADIGGDTTANHRRRWWPPLLSPKFTKIHIPIRFFRLERVFDIIFTKNAQKYSQINPKTHTKHTKTIHVEPIISKVVGLLE